MGKHGTMAAFEDRLESLKDSMRDLVEAGGDRAGAIKDRMVDVKDTVVSGAAKGARRTGAFIKDHPIVSIGIALGIGYVAVRLARR